MIINQNLAPVFEAPFGVTLGTPIMLDPVRLKKIGIIIDLIEVRPDLSFEVTFNCFGYSLEDNIAGFMGDDYGDDEDGDSDDERYQSAREIVIDQMIEWATEKIEEFGIPSGSIIGEPFLSDRQLGTPVVISACFMAEPDESYDLVAFVAASMKVDPVKSEISIPMMIVQMMLRYDAFDVDGSNDQGDPTSIYEFGEQLAWGFPWHMQWALSDLWVEWEKSELDLEEVVFRYPFANWIGKRFQTSEIRSGNFNIPILNLVARPIIQPEETAASASP